MKGSAADNRRLAILAASYAAILVIALVAWATTHVYLGALTVIPILFISYYLRLPAALATAFIAGAVIAVLNANVLPIGGNFIGVPPLVDIFTLSVTLSVIVMVARQLREASVANELLRGHLLNARRAAEHDPLTGIPNRRYFMDHLTVALARATEDECVALFFCDLDGFKNINDTYGHTIGDQLLRMVSARLVNTVRAVDVAARIGGDEFAVLAEHIKDKTETLRMAANIEHAFDHPFQSEGNRYTIGITVGIAYYPDHATDAETLLRFADADMYGAKERKRQQSEAAKREASTVYSESDAGEPLPRPSV